MTQIAFANLNRAEVAPRLALKGGGRRRLDRLIAARTRHLAGKPYLVSVHKPGEIFAPTDESVRLAAVPADAEAHEIPLYEERLWSRTYVASGDIVLITILPQGGGGSQSGAKIGLMVASIALFAFAAWAGPAAFAVNGVLPAVGTPGFFAGKILTAGIMIGGNAILSAFARQGNPNNKLYGISGGGNLARPNERIPVGFGRFWNGPDLSQPDYFSYSGDDMTLFKRMTIGCGKYEIMEIRAGQTTLWRASGSSGLPNGGPSAAGVTTPFAGTMVEIIHGQASSLVPGDVLTSSNVSGITLPLSNDPNPIAGPFRVTAPGVKISRLQVDYSYPSGYFKSNTGTTLPIDLIIEYAECDDSGAVVGAWHDLYREANGGLKIMGPKRFTRTRDVPLAQYVVRARNNVFRFAPDQEANFQRDISWDALRGHRPDSRIRAGITELCMKVQSGKSLTSTSFADIQVKARRLGQVWNGSAFVEGELRKCVDIYADLLTNDDYGGGIDPNLVDLAKIRAYQTGVSAFDTFDGVIRGPDTLWGACKTVLANVRAEPVRIGPGYSFVRDEPKAIRRHTFSRRQIVRGSTSIDYDVQADDGSAHVQIAYHDETDPKRPNYAEQYYGTASAFGPRRIEWPGLSSYAHAVHIARWLAASGFYRRARVSFDTELAGRLVFRGDPIAVDPWFLDGRAVSGVLAAADTRLMLDVDVVVAPGDYAMLRDRNGEEWGPVRVIQGAGPREVILNADDVAAEAASSGLTLVQVLAPENANPTTIIIGSLVEHGEQWLVESMVPKEKGQASLSAKLDSPAVYDAIGAVIPPDSPITWPLVTAESPAIRNFTAAIRQHTSSLELQFSILASAGATLFEVEVSQDGQDYTQFYSGASASGTGPIRYSDTNILVRARAYGSTGVPGEWTAPFALVVPKPVVTATGVDNGVVVLPNLGADAIALFDQASASIEAMLMEANNRQIQNRRLTATQGAAKAQIEENWSVVVTDKAAQATVNTTVQAQIGANTAAITTEQTARTNGDTALANSITSVLSELDGRTANATFRMTTVLAPVGVAARIEMQARVSAGGTFTSGGLAIDVIETAPGSGIYTSQIVMLAEKIFIKTSAGVTKLAYDTAANKLTMYDGVFQSGTVVAGTVKDTAGRFVIDLNYPRQQIFDAAGVERVRIGRLD